MDSVKSLDRNKVTYWRDRCEMAEAGREVVREELESLRIQYNEVCREIKIVKEELWMEQRKLQSVIDYAKGLGNPEIVKAWNAPPGLVIENAKPWVGDNVRTDFDDGTYLILRHDGWTWYSPDDCALMGISNAGGSKIGGE